MKKKILLVSVVLVVLLVLGTVLIRYLIPREPLYNGRPVGAWIEGLTGPVGNQFGAVSSKASAELIQQEPGEEILPFLRATLFRGTTRMHQAYAQIFPKLPPQLIRWFDLPTPNPQRDTQLRFRAGLILYYMEEKASGALPDLQKALEDEDPQVRRIVCAAIGNMGLRAEPAIKGVLRSLNDPHSEVRLAALNALSTVSSDPLVIIQSASKTLSDVNDQVRIESARILKDMAPDSKHALPELIKALEDPNVDVTQFAIMALGKMGAAAKSALPALQQAAQTNREGTSTALKWAIRKVEVSENE